MGDASVKTLSTSLDLGERSVGCGEDDDGTSAVSPAPKPKAESFQSKMEGAKTVDGLIYLWDDNQHKINSVSIENQKILKQQFDNKKKELEDANLQ